MTKELWLNLSVKDLAKSKEFFEQLGFSSHSRQEESEEMAGIKIGNTMVMLFPETTLKRFIKTTLADTSEVNEVLISIDAESREEVDELARKVEAAGGVVFSEPEEIQGWMYGCGFADLDGHRWNVLYMDQSSTAEEEK